MKQLIIDSIKTDYFFDSNINNYKIKQWVSTQIITNKNNIFKLNERFSCIALLGYENEIIIEGDEDYKIIEIVEITPIKL